MEVLILGYPRTGTQSLAEALKILGFGECYHMREVGKNKHQGFWIEALEAKYGDKAGKVPGKEEFDEIFENFNATSDIPSAFFFAELLSAYPSAKVVLSIRPASAWYKSMLATLYHQYTHLPPIPPTDTQGVSSNTSATMRQLSTLTHKFIWKDSFPDTGIEAYNNHNETVRRACQDQGRDVLEYEPGEGWERLSAFLGKEVPKNEKGEEFSFPRQDDWASYK